MIEPCVVVDFAGCKTRAEATARRLVWLDDHLDRLVRAHASRLLAADDDVQEIASEVIELRGELARNRAELLARFAAILPHLARARLLLFS